MNLNISSFEATSNVSSPIAMSVSMPTCISNNRLALVESFYGPGATACWYLTSFSCFVSLLIHPRKRKEDAITNDMVGMVIFPTVASAHLLSQIQSWPSGSSIDDGRLQQLRAALAASLVITETFLPLDMILLIHGVFMKAPKRLCFLEVTGLFCVFAETYLYFALPDLRRNESAFERSFIVSSMLHLTMIVFVALSIAVFLFAYIYLLFRRVPRVEHPNGQHSTKNGFLKRHTPAWILSRISLPIMFIALASSVSSPVWDLLSMITTGWGSQRSFVDEFFPKTTLSIMDLDQSVALLTGMTALGFSLYSAADAQYKVWRTKEEERLKELARHRAGSEATSRN